MDVYKCRLFFLFVSLNLYCLFNDGNDFVWIEWMIMFIIDVYVFLGVGKIYKDVVLVRVMYLILVVCGIYYFEVRIVSKGCDG